MEDLISWFPSPIKTVRTPNAHKLSPLVEQEWIDVQEALKDADTSNMSQEQLEMDLLIEVVQKSL